MRRVYQIFVLDVIGAGFHVQNPFLIVFFLPEIKAALFGN